MIKIRRTLMTALAAIRRNPMRAMLTVLGIVIGIGSVIAMMEVGEGSSTQLRERIASMGANVLLVVPGSKDSSGASQGTGSTMTLSPDDCEAIATGCPSVRAVAPEVRARTQIVYGSENWVPDRIVGTTEAYLEIQNWSVGEGAVFTDRDVQQARCVCLLGQTVVEEIFGDASAVGETVRMNNVPMRVVGVLRSKGANMMGTDQDNIVVAPWTVVKYRITGSQLSQSNQSSSSGASSDSLDDLYPSSTDSLYPEQSTTEATNNPVLVRFNNVDQILAAAVNTEAIPTAIEEITQTLRREHNLGDRQADDFEVRDMSEMTDTLSSTTTLMKNLLLCVAMISLVVGGVGIMNIMLVSVTERTREIGLRMAVGARGRDILRQFLIEAIVLCLIGGVMGIAIGHGGSRLVQRILHWPVQTSPAAIAAAVFVSVSVGILFGFYPAWKASRLDPIEALRYE